MSIAVVLFLCGIPTADDGEPTPPEAGRVTWQRDVDAAFDKARQNHRPVAILFQEIPGCRTCQAFGRQVMSHPLVVEALEDEFTPVLVLNNRKGRDAEYLSRYSEPSWNNPVMRFFSAQGEELTPRKDRIWSTMGVAQRMIESLEAAERDVPDYLRMVVAESGGKRELATFAMHCYWEGEAKLGALEGVVRTEAGWQGGKEVVRVLFDPDRVTYSLLIKEAHELTCASTVFAQNQDQLSAARKMVGNAAEAVTSSTPYSVAPAADQKYYLRHSPARYLPLTPMQATKINQRVGLGRPFGDLLSPRQKVLLKQIVASRPETLKPLRRPDDVAELADYERHLRNLLD